MRIASSSSRETVPAALDVVLKRQRRQLTFTAGVLTFILYLSCLSPTVTHGGDCGELIAASYRLGIAHPTGYPLYCLLGRLFASLIPIGEVGWRYNLLSALLGTLAVAFVTATVHRLLSPSTSNSGTTAATTPPDTARPLWAALGAGLTLSGFIYFGTQNLIAEIYSVNGFFLGALLYIAVCWHQEADWRYAYALGLVLGLSLTAHLSCVFLVPGLFLYAIVQHRERFGWYGRWPSPSGVQKFGAIFALFLIGFSLTLYLPLRSRIFPPPPTFHAYQIFAWWPLDWGHPADFAHWKDHITAKQYKHLLIKPYHLDIAGHQITFPWFARSASLIPGKILALWQLFALQYLWFTPLLLVGAWQAFRSSPHAGGKWLGWALLSTWVLNVGIEINYDVGDLSNFFFPAYIAQSLWMGFGLFWLMGVTSRFAQRIDSKQPPTPQDAQKNATSWQWRLETLSKLGIIGTILLQWMIFQPTASLAGDTLARDRALERSKALETLATQSGRPPYTFIFSNDSLWAFWYAKYVLGRATTSITPWGSLGNEMLRRAPMDIITAQLQSKGSVTFAQWDEKVDRRFPYKMLTEDGNLCLASTNILPPPAKPLNVSSTGSPIVTNNLVDACFRRTPINRHGLELIPEESRATFSTQELQQWQKLGIPSLKREDLAAFEVNFVCPNWPRLALKQPTLDAKQQAIHIGWIEVLIAKRGKITGTPPPAQQTIRGDSREIPLVNSDPPIWVWKQTRRLIVPLRTPINTALQAAVPLQIESDAPTGIYDVWTRLVHTRNDKTTSWTRTDLVTLSHR